MFLNKMSTFETVKLRNILSSDFTASAETGWTRIRNMLAGSKDGDDTITASNTSNLILENIMSARSEHSSRPIAAGSSLPADFVHPFLKPFIFEIAGAKKLPAVPVQAMNAGTFAELMAPFINDVSKQFADGIFAADDEFMRLAVHFYNATVFSGVEDLRANGQKNELFLKAVKKFKTIHSKNLKSDYVFSSSLPSDGSATIRY